MAETNTHYNQIISDPMEGKNLEKYLKIAHDYRTGVSNNRTKTKNVITFCKKLNLFIISFPPDKIPDNYYNIYGPLYYRTGVSK